ncbi:MAG: gamma carbonic anhydrase family protein [Planctomycetales bacterium]|nr:gamma carbonic anhydrase family protein [Planctomycetales bacterium]
MTLDDPPRTGKEPSSCDESTSSGAPLDYRRASAQVDPTAWVAPGAEVCGNVVVEPGASIWFAAVVRGDCERIVIGRESNVQDGAILHADAGIPCTIGRRVTLGHGAIVHGATVGDETMIGIRATVLNRAEIGAGCLIAAGALVPEGAVIPPGSVVMGIPGKVVRAVTAADRARIEHAWRHYVRASQEARKQRN